MTAHESIRQKIKAEPKIWLVTGVAGFIGSNLLEALLKLDQNVVGLDNFSTGHRHNLHEVQAAVTSDQWARFEFIEGDIRRVDDCRNACDGVNYVLHQAALGSVPRSIEDPITTNQNNIDGFLNMLIAARDAKVNRFVYAASSSIYGDHPDLPKVEDKIGKPMSPYAITKLVNELYAEVFARTYGISAIGLRYFNIFGPRQDPNGVYAAVIPKWIASMLKGAPTYINGDGETSRDFCYVENAIQANLLAAVASSEEATNQVYNIAVGEQTSLNQLFELLRDNLANYFPYLREIEPIYLDFRSGDIRHSLADINKGKKLLGYEPTHRVGDGLREAMVWYVDFFKKQA